MWDLKGAFVRGLLRHCEAEAGQNLFGKSFESAEKGGLIPLRQEALPCGERAAA